MTNEEILAKLKAEPNLKRVSDEALIPYATIYRWYSGETQNPGSRGIDKLRSYYENRT